MSHIPTAPTDVIKSFSLMIRSTSSSSSMLGLAGEATLVSARGGGGVARAALLLCPPSCSATLLRVIVLPLALPTKEALLIDSKSSDVEESADCLPVTSSTLLAATLLTSPLSASPTSSTTLPASVGANNEPTSTDASPSLLDGAIERLSR